MKRQQYTTKKGLQLFRPVMKERDYSRESENGGGFCLACGGFCDGVEPDARKYTCEGCGEPRVYGLEELLMRGLLILE